MIDQDTSRRPASVGTSLLGVCVLLVIGGAMLIGIAQFLDGRHGISIPAHASRVDVTLSDYRISAMPMMPIRHGRIAFVVRNTGRIPHELVVFRTDFAATSLPLRADGDANEESPRLTSVVDSGASLASNQTKVFVANLAPGHYVAVCNLPGHYRLGMRLDVSVR